MLVRMFALAWATVLATAAFTAGRMDLADTAEPTARTTATMDIAPTLADMALTALTMGATATQADMGALTTGVATAGAAGRSPRQVIFAGTLSHPMT